MKPPKHNGRIVIVEWAAAEVPTIVRFKYILPAKPLPYIMLFFKGIKR